jgi:hypothetical protein
MSPARSSPTRHRAGSTAKDGNGEHSPFTAAFLANAESPGIEIGQMFRRVALAVNHATGGRQTPELSISLLGDFYLKPGGTTPARPVALPDAAGPPASPAGADKNHALVALDTDFVARQLLKDIADGTRQALSEAKIGFKGLATTSAGLDLQLTKPASGDKAKDLVSAVVGGVLNNGACSSRLDVDDKASLHLGLDRGCFETRGLDSLSEVASKAGRWKSPASPAERTTLPPTSAPDSCRRRLSSWGRSFIKRALCNDSLVWKPAVVYERT